MGRVGRGPNWHQGEEVSTEGGELLTSWIKHPLAAVFSTLQPGLTLLHPLTLVLRCTWLSRRELPLSYLLPGQDFRNQSWQPHGQLCGWHNSTSVLAVFVTSPPGRGKLRPVSRAESSFTWCFSSWSVNVTGAVFSKESCWLAQISNPLGQIEPAEMRVSEHQGQWRKGGQRWAWPTRKLCKNWVM